MALLLTPAQAYTATEYNRDYAVQLAEWYGSSYDVSPKLIMAVLDCETGGKYSDPAIQSGHYYKGKREQSYGWAQIHLPSHPRISLADASNPHYAVNYLALNLSMGNGDMWTCYRNLK